jgi:hypothetical protein
MSSLDMLPLTKLDRLRMESSHNRELRDRFLNDPAGVLREAGVPVVDSATLNIQVIEDDETTHNIVLPPFVGTSPAPQGSSTQLGSASTWECTTCTPTSPICAGSLASLTCVTVRC